MNWEEKYDELWHRSFGYIVLFGLAALLLACTVLHVDNQLRDCKRKLSVAEETNNSYKEKLLKYERKYRGDSHEKGN
jgi:hypothetical protein